MDFKDLQELSGSLPEVEIAPHFDKTSFRVKKKIFVTFNAKNNTATLKLNEVDQDVFSSYDKLQIYPVDNKWGKQGWTIFHLDHLHPDLLKDALHCAFKEVAPKNLGKLIP